MPEASTPILVEKLDGLRTELVDLAFVLECQGRRDAADVAMSASARVGEICDELLAEKIPPRVRNEPAHPLSH